jgi:hypothetical protein
MFGGRGQATGAITDPMDLAHDQFIHVRIIIGIVTGLTVYRSELRSGARAVFQAQHRYVRLSSNTRPRLKICVNQIDNGSSGEDALSRGREPRSSL